MRAQTTQSFPVIRGIGSVLFPLRVSACILNLRFLVFLLPLSRSSGQCRRLLPERHLGQLLLKRDARIGAAYRELCGLRAPEARHRHRHGPLRGLSQAAGLSFRPLALGAGRRNWLLRRSFGLLLVQKMAAICLSQARSFRGRQGRLVTMTVAVYSPPVGCSAHLSSHWVQSAPGPLPPPQSVPPLCTSTQSGLFSDTLLLAILRPEESWGGEFGVPGR
ncbi:hypothetical protein NDU88_006563 [Pleurodeles waltl]|uniref:Uncharacterized protein n=1 Tax=Pleurodeles waltl TaxID=8319 RepID=A0AAV7MCL0_PLEWA|nr:hypothetical protein NDU88_006563 [Pleurodeles waltl]